MRFPCKKPKTIVRLSCALTAGEEASVSAGSIRRASALTDFDTEAH